MSDAQLDSPEMKMLAEAIRDRQKETLAYIYAKFGFTPLTVSFGDTWLYVTGNDTIVASMLSSIIKLLLAKEPDAREACALVYMIHFCHAQHVVDHQKPQPGRETKKIEDIDNCPTWIKDKLQYRCRGSWQDLFTYFTMRVKRIVKRSSDRLLVDIKAYARGDPAVIRFLEYMARVCSDSPESREFYHLYNDVLLGYAIEPSVIRVLLEQECEGNPNVLIKKLRDMRVAMSDRKACNVPIRYAHEVATMVMNNRNWWKQKVADEMRNAGVKRIPTGHALERLQSREEDVRFCTLWSWIAHRLVTHSPDPETGHFLPLFSTPERCERRSFMCTIIAAGDRVMCDAIDDFLIALELKNYEHMPHFKGLMELAQRTVCAMRLKEYKTWLNDNALRSTEAVLEEAHKYFKVDALTRFHSMATLEETIKDIEGELTDRLGDKADDATQRAAFLTYSIVRTRIIGVFLLDDSELDELIAKQPYAQYKERMAQLQDEIIERKKRAQTEDQLKNNSAPLRDPTTVA